MIWQELQLPVLEEDKSNSDFTSAEHDILGCHINFTINIQFVFSTFYHGRIQRCGQGVRIP